MSLELLVDGVGQRHVLEHALQLGCELTAALRLEFADHHLLRIVGSRFLVEQSSSEVSLVILFKGILLLQVSEQDHGLVQNVFNFGVAQTLDALLELVVDE